jgi:hypothetical protein
MKKLLIILIALVAVSCVAQENDTAWYKNEYRNPDVENVDSIIAMMDSIFPIEHVGSIRNSVGSWKRARHLKTIKFGVVKKMAAFPLKEGTVVLDENNPGALRNATFAEELLFLIQDYEEDCYNDSSYIELYQYYDSELPTKLTNMIVATYPIYMVPIIVKGWHHKEPTFKGFSEWIKDYIK